MKWFNDYCRRVRQLRSAIGGSDVVLGACSVKYQTSCGGRVASGKLA